MPRPLLARRRWMPLVAVIGLLALGACRNPVGVLESEASARHTTSSGNHTTSSGNFSPSEP